MTTFNYDTDVTVIGAGVIGMAIAAQLSQAGFSVVLVERHPGPGRETSSRNSEVIHAGFYYPTHSMKARLCVRGNRLLYDFCKKYGVAHRAIGKLVVALTSAELASLEHLFQLGQANGTLGLELIDSHALRRMEPHLNGIAALYSPSTGIIDTHGLIKVLEAQARGSGSSILYQCQVEAIEHNSQGIFTVLLKNPAGSEHLTSRVVVNAAGLESDHIAHMVGITKYQLWWCKGQYFAVTGRAAKLVSHLVYPVPEAHLTSLGVHITLDLGGRMRLGPDASYIKRDQCHLDVDMLKAAEFYTSAKALLPALCLSDLQPDLAGIRPKLQGPEEPWQDFIIADEEATCPGFINLVGLESPGLTSCLAIREIIQSLVSKYF